MSELEGLKRRIAALEAKLAGAGRRSDDEEVDEKEQVAAEIAAFERELAAADKDEDEKACVSADKDEDEGKKASEVDPGGIEEEITQDRFTEVERLTHGTELATGPSMGAVAPTRSEYVARMRSASARLDKVADYLEKHGRRELAFRVDKIADAIDARIKGGE